MSKGIVVIDDPVCSMDDSSLFHAFAYIKEKTKNATPTTELKTSGDNRYELNLDAKKLNSGFYTLEVKNEKNESFYLKIFLP